MGWTPAATRIDCLREAVGQHPARALIQVNSALEETTRPSDLVLLYGLRSACLRILGDLTASAEALQAGERVQRASSLSRAELIGYWAALRLDEHRWEEAILEAERMLLLLPSEKPAKTRWGARQRRHRSTLKAAAHIYRGRAKLIGYDDTSAAAQDTYIALRIEEVLPRTRLAAVVLLARVVCRGGTYEELIQAAQLLTEATRSFPRSDRIAHSECRICRACIVARFGATAEAERLIGESLREYAALGAKREYMGALEVLFWVISERDGKPNRARLVVRNLRAKAPESPRRRDTAE